MFDLSDNDDIDAEPSESSDREEHKKSSSNDVIILPQRKISDPHIYGVRDIQGSLNLKALNDVIYELGIIPLSWPVITEPVFECRTCFPESYYKNSEKEKILFAYAENFRQQFCWKYPNRRPILLQAPNDCNLQKMVCTSIRPTWLPYPEMHSWEGCAAFVADHLEYEPLRKPILLVRCTIFLPSFRKSFYF